LLNYQPQVTSEEDLLAPLDWVKDRPPDDRVAAPNSGRGIWLNSESSGTKF
jgi:hypothetical protein